MLWFNFILGSNCIVLYSCFKLINIHYNTQTQKKIKLNKTRGKIEPQHIHIVGRSYMLITSGSLRVRSQLLEQILH